MRREAYRLRRLAAALGALLLGACAAPGDGLDPPFLTFELESAGVPAQCTAADLAAAEEFAAVADDPGSAVAIVGGEPLCILDLTAPPPSSPRSVAEERSEEAGGPFADGEGFDPSLGTPPGWATGSGRLLKSGDGPQEPPPEYTPYATPGGVVQDPTPQPASPGVLGSSKIVAPPAPAPSPNPQDDDKN